MIINGNIEVSGDYYNLPYYIKSYTPTTLSTSEILTMNVIPQSIIFYQNFTGSYAVAGVAPTNNSTLDILLNNNTSVGYIEFGSGLYSGTFDSSSELVTQSGDILTIISSSNPDPTLGNVAITLSGYTSTNATSGSTNTTSSSGSTAPGIGVFGGGSSSSAILSSTCIYNYSANTTVSGTNLTYTASWLAATGNSTEGVFGGGGYKGSYLSTTSIYNYSANTTVAGTNLTHIAQGLAATGNLIEGVFGGGYNGDTSTTMPLSTTIIYNYSANTTTSGTNLTYTTASSSAATGNSTEGVFGGGSDYSTPAFSTTCIYNYSANTTVAGTNLTYSVYGLAACSPQSNGLATSTTSGSGSTGPDIGVFGGGINVGSYLSTTCIYNYSANTTIAGINLTYTAYGLAATGNAIEGAFGGGTPNGSTALSTTSIYNYSANTTVAGTNLTYIAQGLAATGNSTEGIFGGGSGSTTIIYNYSENTTVAGTNLTYSASWLAATGNTTEGVFGGGTSNGLTHLNTTCIYNYSVNTTLAGTNLTYGSDNPTATGNSTEGVFGGGSEYYNNGSTNGFIFFSTTSTYNYSANTTVAGTNLTYDVSNLAATGNSTEGVFGEGSNGSVILSTTCIYNYSANTTIAGTNLTYTVTTLAACSPQANGLS